jgi:hypothetical protein
MVFLDGKLSLIDQLRVLEAPSIGEACVKNEASDKIAWRWHTTPAGTFPDRIEK